MGLKHALCKALHPGKQNMNKPAFLIDAHNCMNQLRQDAASKDIVMKSGHMFIDILY